MTSNFRDTSPLSYLYISWLTFLGFVTSNILNMIMFCCASTLCLISGEILFSNLTQQHNTCKYGYEASPLPRLLYISLATRVAKMSKFDPDIYVAKNICHTPYYNIWFFNLSMN